MNPVVISRRRFLRLALSAVFCAPASLLPAPAFPSPIMERDLLSQYLGEHLEYQIGFWLFSHCGEASVTLCKTSSRNIYVATMEGKTVGLVDLLLGKYRYSYTSYAGYDKNADRLYPTLKTYHLPLQIHEGFQNLDLTLASDQERKKALAQELDPTDKDYLVRFRVLKEDVSSKSGKIVGWLSKDAVPIKGVIKDVIFFGDLWGVLVKRELGEKLCKPQLSPG